MTQPLCKLCGDPYAKRRLNQLFCSAKCKSDWETGERLLVKKLEDEGIINRHSIKAALAAAGGGEGAT